MDTSRGNFALRHGYVQGASGNPKQPRRLFNADRHEILELTQCETTESVATAFRGYWIVVVLFFFVVHVHVLFGSAPTNFLQ